MALNNSEQPLPFEKPAFNPEVVVNPLHVAEEALQQHSQDESPGSEEQKDEEDPQRPKIIRHKQILKPKYRISELLAPKHNSYRTKMCPDGRQCQNRMSCQYAHTQQELRRPFHNRRRPCILYQRGLCGLGSACRDYHGNYELKNFNQLRYKTSLCQDFENGHCQKEALCLKAHGRQELEEYTKQRNKMLSERPPRQPYYNNSNFQNQNRNQYGNPHNRFNNNNNYGGGYQPHNNNPNNNFNNRMRRPNFMPNQQQQPQKTETTVYQMVQIDSKVDSYTLQQVPKEDVPMALAAHGIPDPEPPIIINHRNNPHYQNRPGQFQTNNYQGGYNNNNRRPYSNGQQYSQQQQPYQNQYRQNFNNNSQHYPSKQLNDNRPQGHRPPYQPYQNNNRKFNNNNHNPNFNRSYNNSGSSQQFRQPHPSPMQARFAKMEQPIPLFDPTVPKFENNNPGAQQQ